MKGARHLLARLTCWPADVCWARVLEWMAVHSRRRQSQGPSLEPRSRLHLCLTWEAACAKENYSRELVLEIGFLHWRPRWQSLCCFSDCASRQGTRLDRETWVLIQVLAETLCSVATSAKALTVDYHARPGTYLPLPTSTTQIRWPDLLHALVNSLVFCLLEIVSEHVGLHSRALALPNIREQ